MRAAGVNDGNRGEASAHASVHAAGVDDRNLREVLVSHTGSAMQVGSISERGVGGSNSYGPGGTAGQPAGKPCSRPSSPSTSAAPKQAGRSRPSTPSRGDRPRLSYVQLHAPRIVRASCLDRELADAIAGPKGSDACQEGAANGEADGATNISSYSGSYSAQRSVRPQSAPPARPMLLDPKAMRPPYPSYASVGWVGPERGDQPGSSGEDQGCGKEAMARQKSSPRHATTTYMHQLATAGAPSGCGGPWGREGGWRGLSGVGTGGGAISPSTASRSCTQNHGPHGRGGSRSPSPMQMGGKHVGGEWVGGTLTSPVRRASHPKPWNYRVGGCCDPRPCSADAPGRVRAHRSSSSAAPAASASLNAGSPAAARPTAAAAAGAFGSLSSASGSGPSSRGASPCSCLHTDGQTGRCLGGCKPCLVSKSEVGRSEGGQGMGCGRERRACGTSCACKLHLEGQRGSKSRGSDLMPDQDSLGRRDWTSKFGLLLHQAKHQHQQQQRPHAGGTAALGRECCRMGDLINDAFLQQQRQQQQQQHEVLPENHSLLARQQKLRAALDEEDAAMHSAVQASTRRYRRAEQDQQKQERLTRMLMEEQHPQNKSASASEEKASGHTTQSITAIAPPAHRSWAPPAQHRLQESDAAAVASATLQCISQRLSGSSSPSSDGSNAVLPQERGSGGALTWASDSDGSRRCKSRCRGIAGRHDSGGCPPANAGLEAALRRRQQRSQLQMLEDQGCSDLPHPFPSMTSHPSKHIQHVHTWKPQAAARLNEGREGEGPQELEGRVRILLGVLERERRGREEEQQKKRELERALEEAQASSQLQACDFQAEIAKLRQRVARLQNDHPAQLGPLFDMYERDMARADAANKIRALEGRVADLVCEVGEAQRCARAHALAARQAELGLSSLHTATTQAAQAEEDSIAAGLKAAEARRQLQSMEMNMERLQEENAMLRQRVKALQLAARSNLQ
ncbi:hypothetical protein DUNSADRAFT_15718 [Dunaliella salina]|uniref:Uncharacterized protein n=1 Tax=Dunaliella salina TaxID=3046 RepID=A0ABQ7H993_DUNSA|nr:hypothetical protein DUNSADRAFT_15718 [Dunaliella salina]|eukprot:KAF5843423.1 hypothetical protein DUNSADRAFT_15718 [Dunaliella salina]